MIVQAALPLVAEYGAAVTTQQVANAAGVGEATIFRAFADKETLLAACFAEAANPAGPLRELASISLEQPLAERLTDALDAMRAHLRRMGAVAGALFASGHRPDRPRPDRPGPDQSSPDQPSSDQPSSDRLGADRPGSDRPSADRLSPDRLGANRPSPDRPGPGRTGQRGAPGTSREESLALMREGLVDLLQPDQDALRVPVDLAARTFLFLSMSAGQGDDEASPAELVDLFLHGALSSNEAPARS